jgi:hypothetical protein
MKSLPRPVKDLTRPLKHFQLLFVRLRQLEVAYDRGRLDFGPSSTTGRGIQNRTL